MAKPKSRAKTTRKVRQAEELDSIYLLKLVLYLIVGAQWLRLETNSGSHIPIPLGLIVGLVFAMHDHFKIDRKIEFAILLVAMFVGFWTQVGIYITL